MKLAVPAHTETGTPKCRRPCVSVRARREKVALPSEPIFTEIPASGVVCEEVACPICGRGEGSFSVPPSSCQAAAKSSVGHRPREGRGCVPFGDVRPEPESA